jgi:DNA-binding MarR family transcriptional regulator
MSTFSKDLRVLIQLVEILRDVDGEMPMQMAHCLLCVALRPGLTMQNLSEMTGLSQSSSSRNIQTLGEWHRHGKPGYNLVQAVDDPVDTRRKIMFLTPKGKQVLKRLLSTLRGEAVTEIDLPNPKDVIGQRRAARRASATGA